MKRPTPTLTEATATAVEDISRITLELMGAIDCPDNTGQQSGSLMELAADTIRRDQCLLSNDEARMLIMSKLFGLSGEEAMYFGWYARSLASDLLEGGEVTAARASRYKMRRSDVFLKAERLDAEAQGSDDYLTFITTESNGVPPEMSIMKWKPEASDNNGDIESEFPYEPLDFDDLVTSVRESFKLLVQRGRQHIPGAFDDYSGSPVKRVRFVIRT